MDRRCAEVPEGREAMAQAVAFVGQPRRARIA